MNPTRSQLLRVALTSVDDSGPQQLVKVTGLAGQQIGEAVRSQAFGLTSNPPQGAEGVMLAIGAGHDRAHALGLEHPQYRPTNTPSGGAKVYDIGGNYLLLDGSTATILHKASGNYVKLDSTGNIVGYIKNNATTQHYVGGDPAKGGSFSRIVTEDGPSNWAQARVA